MFRQMLEYKVDWCGKNVKVIAHFEPSSKACNHCGFVNKDLQLKDRKWICPQCGIVIDRDINAAKNSRDVAFGAESENSPSESRAMAETIEGTWRELNVSFSLTAEVTNPKKRQDSKSANAQ